MVMLGVLWLEAMHWWILTPMYPGEVNRYWLIFWPTLLLATLGISMGAYAVIGLVGDGREREQRLMLLVAVFSSLLILLGALLDGPNVSHEQFAGEVILAAVDIFGALVGAAFAILLFAVVLAIYESQQPAPHRLDPPTATQLAQASQLIAHHLGGETEDE